VCEYSDGAVETAPRYSGPLLTSSRVAPPLVLYTFASSARLLARAALRAPRRYNGGGGGE